MTQCMFLVWMTNWSSLVSPRLRVFGKTPWEYTLGVVDPEWFKLTRCYPDMCLNGVNTQWVYSQGVIQKPLDHGHLFFPAV